MGASAREFLRDRQHACDYFTNEPYLMAQNKDEMIEKEKAFNDYAEKVSKTFEVEEKDIFSNKKHRRYVDARQTLYYLCHIRPMRISYIQDYVIRRGYEVPHSCIHYGIDVADKKFNNDRDYRSLIKRLK